jgi:hypothetical protein
MNPEAEKVKDLWIVLGQEMEESEGITIQRNWLWGVHTNRSGLILNFGTPYSPLETSVLPGTIIEAELTFFPAVWKQRAVLSMQKSFVETFSDIPTILSNWQEAYQYRTDILSKFPFANDIPLIINSLRMVFAVNQILFIDDLGNYHHASKSWSESKMQTLYAYVGNAPVCLAGVYRRDGFSVLGIIEGDKYILI